MDGVVRMTGFMYAKAVKGSMLKLYIMNEDVLHYGPIPFTSGNIKLKNMGTIIPALDAATIEMAARNQGLETKVTDSGDMLVFHSKNGSILYPKDTTGGAFWSSV